MSDDVLVVINVDAAPRRAVGADALLGLQVPDVGPGCARNGVGSEGVLAAIVLQARS